MGIPRDPSAPAPMPRTWRLGIRRALPADREAVLAFANATWGGWDYLGRVWGDWVADTVGALLVGTAEPGPDGAPPADRDGNHLATGQVVAVTHLAMLSPTEGWIEGIRVDPRVRGMDVATDLQRGVLAAARDRGAAVVRYVTSQDNAGSLRLAARLGLERVGTWRVRGLPWVDADPDPGRVAAVREALATAQAGGLLVPPDADAGAWFERIAADATFRAGHGLYEHASWDHEALTEAKLADRIGDGEVLALGPDADGRWAALVINRADSLADGALRPALLVGDGALAVRLLERLGGAAGPLPRLRLPDPAPLLDGHAADWERLGYPAHEGSMVIVEGRLA